MARTDTTCHEEHLSERQHYALGVGTSDSCAHVPQLPPYAENATRLKGVSRILKEAQQENTLTQIDPPCIEPVTRQ